MSQGCTLGTLTHLLNSTNRSERVVLKEGHGSEIGLPSLSFSTNRRMHSKSAILAPLISDRF